MVVIRAEAGVDVGLGHMTRCLALAHAFTGLGAAVTFATGSERAAEMASRAGHPVHRIASARGSNADAVETLQIRAGTIVVVDGYDFDDAFLAALAAERRTCLIDDLGRRPPCLLVNPNPYGADLYPDGGPSGGLLGAPYALVSPSFRVTRHEDRPTTGNPRVLVTFGGADPARLTAASIDKLNAVISKMEVRVLVGPANGEASRIESAARESRHEVAVVIDAANIAEHFAWADVAIAAAGTTCLELACVGVPSLLVVVAENQRRGAEYFHRGGYMLQMGSGKEALTNLPEMLSQLLQDTPARESMRARQRALIDGRGADRVARHLLSIPEPG